MPLVVPIPQAFKAFDEGGNPNDPAVKESLKALGKEVTRIGLRLSRKEIADPAAACDEAAKRLALVASE